jgi:MFS family permease
LGDIFHWQMLFIYIGLPGVLLSLLILTIKEPLRRETNSTDLAIAPPSFRESLAIIWEKRTAYMLITIATSFTAFVSYGSSAWIPTYFNRTFGWQMREIGFKYGIIVTIFATLGVLAGGWLADRYNQQGKSDGKVWVGLLASIGIFFAGGVFLLSDPNVILMSLAIPSFLIAFPFGAAVAAVQELMPNRARALASAIFLFFVNMIGMGGGPLCVAFFTDSILHDEKMIKHSIVALYLIGGFLATLFYYIALKPYRKEMSN